MIGLAIYMVPYVLVFRRLTRVLDSSLGKKQAGDSGRFAAALLALIIALLLTIFTTSSFSTVTFMLVMLLALPVSRLTAKTSPAEVPLDIPSQPVLGLDGLPFARR